MAAIARRRDARSTASPLVPVLLMYALVVLVALGAAPVPAVASISDSDCADCHDAQDDPDTPFVPATLVASSVHEGLSCLDCHTGIADLPHEETLPSASASCGSCHEDVVAAYDKHGRADVGSDPDIPDCADCHGSHQILPPENPQSSVYPRHLPATCGRCHSDTDLAKKHDIMLKQPVEVYEASVHGKALMGGKLSSAATCNDCHSTGGSAHHIYGPGDPRSTINHFNIPHTCGQCHDGIEEEYWEGIHGQLAARGETDTPVCTHCHGEHGILRVDDPRARVSSTQVAEATCAPCHESAFLNEKYGLPAGRLASFVDSYHGLKSKAGDTRVANCASCHGGHRILPSTDPRSSIYPDNLQETCGHCHPAISDALAHTKIHTTGGSGTHTGLAQIVAWVYTALIVLVIGFMVVYAWIDWSKQAREIRKLPQVVRMPGDAVAQHTVLMVSFGLLVLTGFALRFSEWQVFQVLFGWDGGFQVRGTLHRASAVLFMFGCSWHLVYLLRRPGRRFLRDMWPTWTDAKQLGQMIAYNLDKRRERPEFGRFGFVEKMEYWALIWGSVVMLLTGLALWFDNFVVERTPKGFLDVTLVIHFYEAILATLAIAVWHLYSTIFSPHVYPGNPSWITGTMPASMHHHEHGAETPEFPEAADAPPTAETS